MGTNFYLHSDRCPTCGHEAEPLHIGKSSAGWCFSLKDFHIDEPGFEPCGDALADWVRFIDASGRTIRDEYGSEVHLHELLAVIMLRWRKDNLPAPNDPHGEPGPFNLLRHRIDGTHCIGHGAGTWDILAGEFS